MVHYHGLLVRAIGHEWRLRGTDSKSVHLAAWYLERRTDWVSPLICHMKLLTKRIVLALSVIALSARNVL